MAGTSPPRTTNGTAIKKLPQTTPQQQPFLPTTLESLLLAIYPVILLLGSTYSLLSPLTRGIAYEPTLQSHAPHLAPSYFARKRNVFNLYFVKIGWFWTTVAVLVFAFTHPSFGPGLALTRRRVNVLVRWAGATLCWMVTTQWFFGPPLIDRSFRLTGGACEIMADPARVEEMGAKEEFVTSAACKLAGGVWKGGHDISGHVFLLVLGSAIIGLEVLPVVWKLPGLRELRTVVMPDGAVKHASALSATVPEQDRVAEKEMKGVDAAGSLGTKFALAVMGLKLWMLLMTAVFFHTWFEKFTGLGVGLFSIWMVYLLPRAVPQVRALTGMPGI
ncbi:hypothetical protein K402DRAFT_394955 [Aulographum hederae CBS 113979]|uniref:Acyl-coenzyme A diphosphatase SCS3 n=1 Tax=Aulographum hederae CBS 113979 TaxID=1176131 RepID=A0A6G1GWX9_9PEZI|nr:hypothetical protein K402DRAFT_394955 [Aulographum hederae CBS 113979]